MRNKRERLWRGALVALAALVLALGGCAGLGMTDDELRLLEASTADARFVARTWAGLTAAEQKEFADQNALRWGYFNDLAHGRRPALTPSGEVAGGFGDE